MRNNTFKSTLHVSQVIESHHVNTYGEFISDYLKYLTNHSQQSLYDSACSLFKSGLMGNAIREINHAAESFRFARTVRESLEPVLKTTLNSFDINSVRVVTDYFKHNRLPWHQDEATWYRQLSYRNKFPLTIWTPLMAEGENPSTIEVFSEPSPKLEWHKEYEKQGFFQSVRFDEFTLTSSNNTLLASLIPGDATVFSSMTMHRTTPGSGRYVRISMDVRALLSDSLPPKITRDWKYFFLNKGFS